MYHRKIPTLSTWDVAKKSLVGESEILVALLGVLNASISRPDGMSNVLMIESRDVVTSHRLSAEKVYSELADIKKSACLRTISSILPLNPPSSRTIRLVSISSIRTTMSSEETASRPLSRLSNRDTALAGRTIVCSNFAE